MHTLNPLIKQIYVILLMFLARWLLVELLITSVDSLANIYWIFVSDWLLPELCFLHLTLYDLILFQLKLLEYIVHIEGLLTLLCWLLHRKLRVYLVKPMLSSGILPSKEAVLRGSQQLLSICRPSIWSVSKGLKGVVLITIGHIRLLQI